MGYPVVHFEVVGKDGPLLRSFYSDLFGWNLKVPGEVEYAMVPREENLNPDGIGIGGGVGQAPEGYPGHVTFYIEVPDVEDSLAKAEGLGGTRIMGPEEMMPGLVVGMFTDPEGHTIGLVRTNPA
ncbi:MAG TPA: VOC family protein [Acidimicrobiales bacterium]|nr:VOC family protein [Acidimicrobiales bacterium]